MSSDLTPPKSRFRSAVWRLSAVYAVAFLACAMAFSIAAFAIVRVKNAERLSDLAALELASVLEKVGEGPSDAVLARATAVVVARAARPDSLFDYSLSRDGHSLAGDRPPPERSGPDVARLWAEAGGQTASAGLPGGARLSVTRRPAAETAYGDMARVLGFSLVLASVSALLVGPWAGRRVVRQVAAVNRACDRVRAGDLNARAPGAEADDELGDLARHVNAMLARLEALVTGLSDVSNRVAHELRTPMSRLRDDLHDAAHAPDLVTARLCIGAAQARTDDLLQTFEALLDIVEVEAGSVGGLSPIRLDEAVAAAVELYTPVAEDRGLALHFAAEPAPVIGERTLIVRMVANLLDNAIKFSPDRAAIVVRCALEGQDAILEVCDQGPGVRPDEREAVMGRFKRGSAAPAAPGHGLGLALVAAVAKRHGAKLELIDAAPGLRVRVVFRAFLR